jgi:hypothetical protein
MSFLSFSGPCGGTQHKSFASNFSCSFSSWENWNFPRPKLHHNCGLFRSVKPLTLFSVPREAYSYSAMPISNGDAMTNTAANALDYTKALEVLKNEYTERDGIDVKTLIDSKKNGGLTYNDFLMLPGYIGAFVPHAVLVR